MACIFTTKVVFPWRSRGALALINAYAEYVPRTFNIRSIRSEYAARRLAMHYANDSHTLKTSRRAWAYDNVANV